MIAWLETKVVSLLLVALLLVGGFALYTYMNSKLTQVALEATTLNLVDTKANLVATSANFTNYQAQVAKDQQALKDLQVSIAKVNTNVISTKTAVKNYSPNALLDTPWPDDFIRLRGSATRVPSSTSYQAPKASTVLPDSIKPTGR